MFNEWKKNYVELTEQEIRNLDLNINPQKVIKACQYLKTLPDLKTRKEVDEVFKNENRQLRNTLKKMKWDNKEGNHPYWIYRTSARLRPINKEIPTTYHRLYINIDAGYVYKLSNLLLEKCKQHQIPYNFKFNEDCNRDDCFVIYSSNEYLLEYIDILKKIITENKSLLNHIKRPTIASGLIDGWLGYGAEPINLENGQSQSFNILRAKVLEKALDATVSETGLSYYYSDEKINNLIAEIASKKRFSLLIDKLMFKNKNKEITLKELFSDAFYNKLYFKIKQSLNDKIYNLRYSNVEKKKYTQKFQYNEKNLSIDIEEKYIDKVLTILIERLKNNSNFKTKALSNIKRFASFYGIDENKFCFDSDSKIILQKSTRNMIRKFLLCIAVLEKENELELRNKLNHFLEKYSKDNGIEIKETCNLQNKTDEEIKKRANHAFKTIIHTLNTQKESELYDDIMNFAKIYFSGKTKKELETKSITSSQNDNKRNSSVKDDFIIDEKSNIIDQRECNIWERVINLQYANPQYDYKKDESIISKRNEYINKVLLKMDNESIIKLIDKEGKNWDKKLRKIVEHRVDNMIIKKIESTRSKVSFPKNKDDLTFEEMHFAMENFNIIAQFDKEYVYDNITNQEVENERTEQVVKTAYKWKEVAGVTNYHGLIYSEEKIAFDNKHKEIFNFIKKQVDNDMKTDGIVVPKMIEDTLNTKDEEYQRVYQGLFNGTKNPNLLKKFFYPTYEPKKVMR